MEMGSRLDPDDAIPLPSTAGNTLLTVRGRNASNSASIPSAASHMLPNMFVNPAIQPTSVINLTSSSDVVIGPMTQYQGPVTIYQYMDATVEARAMQANGGITHNRNNQTTSVLQRATQNSKILIVILLIVILAAGLGVYFIYTSNSNKNDERPREILFGNNYENGVIPNLGNGHLVIDRLQWGTSDRAKRNNRLEQPIPYVLITHIGVQSTPCFSVYKCSIKMRTIQDAAIAEKNLTDIPANFYIGSDGYVYVGRGWDYANAYANKTLAVAFMGDYIRHVPEPKQLEAAQFLLAYAVTNKHITLDYKLVAQNQTKKSKSPGANVYKEIIKWPHWYACGNDNNPKCGEEIGIMNWEENS